MTRVLCLDTSVWICYLVPEIYQPQARIIVEEALSLNFRLVAPAYAWAEVGSVLRKKSQTQVITTEEAQGFFEDFCELPIDYIEAEAITAKTWEIAEQYKLLTLYDAAFLACAESISAEFCPADQKQGVGCGGATAVDGFPGIKQVALWGVVEEGG